jgi:enoyl-CoA hydratase/carnithine racemase
MAKATTDVVDLSFPARGIALVTLNLPHVRNAMTAELTAAWIAVMNTVAADRSLRVAIVTGSGPAFCSGADLSWLDQGSKDENTPDRLREKMLPFYRAWLAPRYLSIPVVAAVNGPAVGAGLCLALSCDLRYASATATFSAPFIELGTHGGMAASWLLPETIGLPRAREMLYTGRVIDAEEALSWGLVSGVSETALTRSLEVASDIASAAPIAARLTKAGLDQAARGGLEGALQWEALAQPVTMSTADIHEGIRARRQRRRPKFSGD